MTNKPTNSLVKNQSKKEQMKFSVALQTDAYQNLINNTLRDKAKADRFIASISSAVACNKELALCEAGSILSGALLGEALGLSPSPQLGHFYLVPFADKNNSVKIATFQIGYKGYLQLAIRSGQYKKINVLDIKEGELIKYDPLEETLEIKMIENEVERENAKTVGYYAMFELTNGFRKTMYWSKEKMESHATKYSQAYRSDKQRGYSYSFWTKNFDGMAFKTMLRQLISKWGIMSIEMQQAFTNDMGVIKEDGTVEYVDNVDSDIEFVIPNVNGLEPIDSTAGGLL